MYEDLIHFFQTNVSELPYPELYDLLIIWLFHTYLIEKFQYSPYLWFYAVPSRGKSRTGKALIWTAYRGVRVESLREAYLLRAGQDFSASLFFDTKDLWAKAEKLNSEDILLNRWERGMKVIEGKATMREWINLVEIWTHYMDRINTSSLKCSICGRSHDEVGILLDITYFREERTVCKKCYRRLS